MTGCKDLGGLKNIGNIGNRPSNCMHSLSLYYNSQLGEVRVLNGVGSIVLELKLPVQCLSSLSK